MPNPNQINVNSGDNLVLVGTVKGAFVFRSDATREKWEEAGPYFPGRSVYSMAYDGRHGRSRLWAAVNSSYWGSFLSSSNDFGKTWSDPETYNIKFPEDSDVALKQIWQIANDPHDADSLYCGVEPAALFKSADAGETWALERGLFDHPHRPQWMPGGGGLCLHTILPDPTNPERLFVAISTGGVYRSDDSGDSWNDIGKGLPSDFGFAMEIDPHDANTVYIIPIESDEFRCTPEAKLRVYRTKNAGESWEPLTEGLPQEDAFETILRDNMKADANDPTGLYFGTRSGKLFVSTNGGDSWAAITEGLPAITCVKTAT